MPELPEVECLRRALAKAIVPSKLTAAKFYRGDLREKIPVAQFKKRLTNETIVGISRRSKFLLFETKESLGIFHLGMTGKILCLETAAPKFDHTHAVFTLEQKGGKTSFLHFIDPRRFGMISCCGKEELASHKFFAKLGPEPLATTDLGKYLFSTSRSRKTPVKSFLMDAHTVVGVGNIYASESLFRAKIHPLNLAGNLAAKDYDRLAKHIVATLNDAITAGGTTFRDFQNSDGNPGYFVVSLNVYDREGKPCKKCKTPIDQVRLSGRSTFFCPNCQPAA